MPNGFVFSEPSVEMAQWPTVVFTAPLADSPVESGKRLAYDSPVRDINAANATTATRIVIRLDTLLRQALWGVLFIFFFLLYASSHTS